MGHCTWANMNAANKIYHDTEWGIPVHDGRQMFEHLTPECMAVFANTSGLILMAKRYCMMVMMTDQYL